MSALPAIINQKEMRDKNLVEVFDLIRKNGELTRKEIADKTGLSWGGVSQIVSQLLRQSMICEKKLDEEKNSGRTPTSLYVNNENNFVLGIDINLSGFTACVMSADSQIIYTKESQPDTSDKSVLLLSVYKLIDEIFAAFVDKKFLAIGVSMQGRVNEQSGQSVILGNVKGWERVELRDILSEKYDIPVYLAHDPDCLITASNKADAVLLRIDYGMGMAVIKNGCLISAEGMLEIGRMHVGDNGERLSDVATLTALKNRKCDEREFFKDFVSGFSLAVSNMLLVFDLKNVVVCGKMLEYKNIFFDEIKEKISALCGYDVCVEVLDVKKAASGAALIVLDRKKYVI